MPQPPNEDLFADTTMSFGEHLEELRSAIAKSVIGVVVGFIIGLCIGEWIVDRIQDPLRNALVETYLNRALDDVKQAFRDQGEELPPDVEEFIRREKMVFEKVFVEAGEVVRVPRVAHEHLDAEAKVAAKKAAEAKGAAEAQSADQAAEESSSANNAAVSPPAAAKVAMGPKSVILDDKPRAPQPALVQSRIWRPIRAVVKTLSAQEAFMIWIKAAFVAGLVISGPFVFWQVWAFVAAGLYPHEKRYVHVYLPFSIGLFLAGAALAYFVVFPYILDFLLAFNRTMNIDPDPRLSEWLSFVLLMPLGFGIAFQLPLVMLFLNRIRIFSIEAYVSKWRIAVLVIAVLSAILTPSPDPVSMILMAVPMVSLYFLGIGLCKWMPRNKNPYAESYEP